MMRAQLAAVAALLFLAACEEETAKQPDLAMAQDMDVTNPDFAIPDLAIPVEFADFVLGLINTQTADNTVPTPTEDKAFVDAMDPTKFTPLF